MDNIASVMDDLMSKMNIAEHSPVLNEEKTAEHWLSQPGSPKPERPDQQPKTMSYEQLVETWK